MKTPETLIDYLNNVHDRASFFDFVRALIRDREESIAKENAAPEHRRGWGAFGWQHGTIESYLEGALACAEAKDSRFTEPSWRTFAEFLYAGKIYE